MAAFTQKISAIAVGALVVVTGMTGVAQAATFRERGDAGETLDTAQDLGTIGIGRHRIFGSFQGTPDADLFEFYFEGGTLRADTINRITSVDTQLFLFDADGFGIIGNDNRRVGADREEIDQSRITVENLAAGHYFLGLSSFDYDPQGRRVERNGTEVFGEIFRENNRRRLGNQRPTNFGERNPLFDFSDGSNEIGNYRPGETSNYRIDIRTTPEPASMLGLLMIAGVGATVMKRKSCVEEIV